MVSNANVLQSFLLIFYLFVRKKYYLQAYLDNFAHKIVNIQMVDQFGHNIFELLLLLLKGLIIVILFMLYYSSLYYFSYYRYIIYLLVDLKQSIC